MLGGRQAAHTRLSCTRRRWRPAQLGTQDANRDAGLWTGGCVALSRGTARRTRDSRPDTAPPRGPRTCLGLERRNPTLRPIVTDAAARPPPRQVQAPAPRLQEGAGSGVEQRQSCPGVSLASPGEGHSIKDCEMGMETHPPGRPEPPVTQKDEILSLTSQGVLSSRPDGFLQPVGSHPQ